MLTQIVCLAVVTTTFLIAAGQADNPDKFKPPQLAGDQPPSNDKPACPGKFHFSSDVENAGPGHITLNNFVLNQDSDGLVYRWAKADRIRGVLNPLPSGITDENPHPIDSYEDKPDRDAPIEYTPQKCIRTASIYVETKPASSDTVWSIIKSKFKDLFADGALRDLVVEMTTVKEGNSLTYTIKADPPDIFIGLSGLLPGNQMATQAADQSVEMFKVDLQKFLLPDDQAAIPASWPREFTIFSLGKSASGAVRLSLSAEESVPSSEVMIIFDAKRNLITTGRISTLLPVE